MYLVICVRGLTLGLSDLLERLTELRKAVVQVKFITTQRYRLKSAMETGAQG